MDPWTKYLVQETSGTENISHASRIGRHIIFSEDTRNLASQRQLVSIDFKRPDFPITFVIVPSWPVEPWRGLVQTVRAHFCVSHPCWGRESRLWVHKESIAQNILRK